MFREPVYDVALGDNAVDRLAISADDENSDAPRFQAVDDICDRGARPDRLDGRSLVFQDHFDMHGRSSIVVWTTDLRPLGTAQCGVPRRYAHNYGPIRERLQIEFFRVNR